MSLPFTLNIRVHSSFAIGGVARVDRTHHGASARGHDGRPYIPATALRGALRSTLEALVRGAAEASCSDPESASEPPYGDACAGGTGLPADAPEEARPIPCTRGKGGQRCLACRLFGGQHERLPLDSPFFSALVLGDAALASDATWTTRPTVGIQRSTRAANDRTLAMHEVPAPARELVFTARGRLLDPDLLPIFENVVRATTHLGAGRSRGLGRVELDLRLDAPEPARAVDIPGDAVRLRVELLTPALFGVPIADDNLRDTRHEIPGSALRGAIGFALAEALRGRHSPDQPDLAFEQLVAEDGARFGFLYPVDPDHPTDDATPLPATALACKFEGAKHSLVDGLLDAIVADLADDLATAERVAQSSRSARCRHPGCDAPLRSFRRPRAHLSPLPTRTVTRLAMDRRLGSAKNQMLFTQVLLEPGTVFEGSIHHIPDAARERLALALQQPLSLGRGRASGWGKVHVTVLPPPQLAPLHERAAAFHHALAERLADAELSPSLAERWLAVNLLAPLIPDDRDEDGAAALERLLPAKVRFRARRFVREGGWDQRGRGMEPTWAVGAGGVFALQLHDGVTIHDVLPRLLELERDGLGQRRHQGYGAVRCFDPFHCGSPS
ncbi:MAG TPA: RAMP superfamily CRISPR-associated protein [Nannocystis sp.]